MNIVTSYSLGLFVTFSPAQFLAHGKSNGRKNRPSRYSFRPQKTGTYHWSL